ncbi:MAG TPA: hypothetical protein VGG21_03260 [Acidimicrobiales bacterium]|jgi:hypothetical protein
MALFDKVKEQASQLAQKAQEAGKAGQAKIEDVQAKRKQDGMLRDLGAAVYAERSGSVSDNKAEVDRLVAEIKAFEAERDAEDASGASSPSSEAKSDTDETPEGGFTL